MCAKTIRKPYRILSPELWTEIRRQYIAGIGPAEICRRFGVPRSTLTTRRSEEDWDTQRDQLQAVRHRLEASCSASEEQLHAGRDVLDVCPAPSRGGSGEQLWPHAPTTNGDDVRTFRTDDPTVGPGSLQEAYLEFSEVMHLMVELMVSDESLGGRCGTRPTRNILEAARALEKLQQVERAALGLDSLASAPATRGVIVVPSKLSIEEWQDQVGAGGEPES